MTKYISPIFCLGLILCTGIIPALAAVTDSGLQGWYGSEDSARQITLSTGVFEQIERPIAYSNTLKAEEIDMLEIRAELEPKIGESLSLLTATSDRPLYKPGSIIVRFKPDIASSPVRLAQASNAAHTQLGATVTTDYSNIGLPGMQALHLPDGVSVAEAVQIYSRNPNVLYAEPNYYYYVDIVPDEVHSQNLPAEDGAERIPNDPEFGKLWGLHNTGQVISGRAGTVDADIDAPEAWSITTGSPDVIIAVIDTGVMYTHPDLAANIWKNPGEIPGNGIDDDHNGYIDDVYGWNFYDDNNDPNDLDGHGTHCAGTIAGVGNNTEGVAGVMWNAKIMSLQFLSPDGPGDTANAILAIQYATMMGADIISCSWGGGGYSQALKDAIDASPALVVCAAGNDGMDNDAKPSYPSSYTSANILAVAASNNIEQLASFSNIGATSVDVVAPGETIYSTYITHPRVTAFCDPMDSLNAWNADAPWGLNTTHYVSPPSSADDSPGGNYAPNTYAWLTTKNPIDLRGLQGTTLTFAARWELETGSDVLHVVSSPDDYDYYTHGYLTGSSDGEWGSITVPFDMYDGSQVYIGFLLQTDGTVQKDGVLIDDIRITVIEPGSVTAGYGYLSGTSMATPHVSGVAGLIRSINTSLSATEIKDAIINTVDKKPAYTGKVVSGGRVNAYSALNAVTPVIEPAPQADFTANVTTGPAPLAAQFTDTSTGSPTSWLWSFGDGATSTAQNPIHTYTTPGTYTVSLTATNAGGSSTETRTNYITVTTPPPVAAFTANVTTGPAPLAVQFTDISTGSPTSWLWNFGDGETSTAQNPIHTYTTPGTYTVSLTATNAGGSSTETRTGYITVATPPPVAAFTANVTTGPAPLAVQFTDTSTGSPTSWLWSFGDGETSTAQNPIHTYTTPGTYTVSLTATNAGGSSTETKIDYITVEGQPAPIAAFTANVTTGPAPLAVQFTDISTGSPTSWLWSFGDGETSTAQNPTHTYTTPGTYTVSLTATNAGGSSTETRTNYITVEGQPAPVAAFTANVTTGPAPLAVQFTDTSTGNPTSWLWNFGDGATSTAQNPIHTYTTPGTYTVSLTATNAGGSSTETKIDYITVGQPAPVATFTANVTTGPAPLAVQFTDTSTGNPTSWLWSFGDGATSTAQNPIHTYTTPGTYTVSLTATNAGGSSTETRTNYITVEGQPAPIAAFTANVTTGPAPLTVQFTDTSTGSPTSWLWSFGDGETSTAQNPIHTYTTPGTYTVSLTATNAGGSSTETRTNYITVTTPPPVAAFTANVTTGPAPLAVQFTDISTGSPTSWLWSFGDGETSTAQNPIHTYTTPGTYTVSLTATNAGGSSTETRTNYITVTTPPPVAAFTANVTTGPAPLAVQFTDISTGSPTSWLWNFGDGATSTAQNPIHTYTAPGTYTVSLTATNAGGSSTETRTGYITVTPVAPFLASITVAPASATLAVGETRQFNATGYDQYGVEMPVTVAWLCSNETVGRIDNGLFTALAPGTALVNATNSTVTGSAVVTVTTSGSPENGSIVVTANVTGAAILLDGADTGLVTASASSVIIPDVLAGTHTVGVGSVTGYRTPPAQTVTVLPGGAVDVTFMFEPLTLAAIVVAPGTAILEPGDLQQFTAIGYDQYGDEMPIVAAWSCTNESVGTIDSAGLFTALSPGTVTVMASASGIVGTAAVTVLPTGPVLTSITLSPIEVMLTIGESEQFTALCRDQYGEPMDEIPVTWSVDNESVGTIDATGLFTATGAGTTGVTAAAGEITGSANVTVVPAGPAPIDVIIVSPAAVTLDIGCIQQFTATCYDADGTLIPGAAVVWTVTDGAVGRIDDDGLFTAIGEGTTTVAATLDGVTGTATVTVRSPPSVLARIEVCPPCTTLDVGETYRFAATGYDRFGNVIPDLAFTWSCSDPCIGSIDDCGLFTALAEGTATITASAGCIQGTACVTVRCPAPTLTCIEISPADATLTVGSVQQFVATAYDQCGNRMDCVKFTWSCSDPCVGSIDDCGLFTALAPGTATITASAGCIQGIACVAVEAPPITCIEISPADATLTVGSVQQFTATAYDQCGNRVDCVKFTWSCSDPCVGSIDDCGLFTALAPGTATITASAGCIQGIACVAVEAPPITLYADFSADVTCGAAPLTVRFTDCSAGCPASHAWEFGDGGSSTEQNPVHVYDTAGTYTVTLTVENAGGNDTCRRADYITVTEPAGPAPGHSGGSSSSSGGGSPPAIRAGASRTFGDLTGSAVTGVTLTASGDIERVMLAVKTARLPAGVEPPETPVYEYVEITLSRANPADIGNATIEFVVPMAWFEENGLAPDDAVLLRCVNGTWETLPTEYLGMEDGNCQFRATTEGFSYFAVSAAEGAPLAATTPVVEAVAAGVEETTTVPAATTVPATPLLFAPALAPFILLLLGGRRKN